MPTPGSYWLVVVSNRKQFWTKALCYEASATNLGCFPFLDSLISINSHMKRVSNSVCQSKVLHVHSNEMGGTGSVQPIRIMYYDVANKDQTVILENMKRLNVEHGCCKQSSNKVWVCGRGKALCSVSVKRAVWLYVHLISLVSNAGKDLLY